MKKPISFQHFQQKEIRRTGVVAEIIYDYSAGRPVRLIGFTASSDLSDFEILELGFEYYEALIAAVSGP